MEVEPWTPVHQAVESNDYEELAALLDAGADPNEVCFGMTLLAHAIDLEGDSTLQSGYRRHAALTAIVLAYGADPTLISRNKQTPLEIAKEYDHEPAKLLLRRFLERRGISSPEVRDSEWLVRVVVVEENVLDSCFTVGLAEDEYGEGRYLTFQCGLEGPGDQERTLGLDSYCIINETGGVYYGGVENVSLSANRIFFRFTPEAVEKLDLPAGEINLYIASEPDVESLRGGLRRVLTYGNPEKVPSELQL
ncbi:Imm10 family immunity protein [Streptomyces sp. NPDC056704]|uniref:Imm10 family immunity protein n=1 Tax=Streptomyces sp. NPDC056704 TaxID=3345917 RepID=UPI003695DDAA